MAVAPHEPAPSDYAALYALLHNVSEEARAAAQRVRPEIVATVNRLRATVDQLTEELRRWEELRETLDQLCDPGRIVVLRGGELARVAVQVLRESDRAHDAVHYREWFRLVEANGYRVGGVDPLATFLTALSRSPGVVSAGPRTGLYRLKRTDATA